MNKTIQEISNIGIVPVIALEDASQAVPLARALTAGGLPIIEITFFPCKTYAKKTIYLKQEIGGYLIQLVQNQELSASRTGNG